MAEVQCYKPKLKQRIRWYFNDLSNKAADRSEFNELLKVMNKGKLSEEELRQIDPHPRTYSQLKKLIRILSKKYNNDYGKATYCISIAAMGAFNLMSHKVGATGFQASYASNLIFMKVHFEARDGFTAICYNNILYPHKYNNPENFPTKEMILENNKHYFAKKAKELLETHYPKDKKTEIRPYEDNIMHIPSKEEPHSCHPDVYNHWKWLASLDTAKEVEEE